MDMTKEQEALFKKTMEEAKKQLEEIDEKMEQELEKIRAKLAELQESKKSFRQVYEGTAKLLGIEIELEDEEKPGEERKEEEEKGATEESQPSAS